MPTLDLSADDRRNCAKAIAETLPEYQTLKQRLRSESRTVHNAVATTLIDWVEDPITSMSQEERQAHMERCKAELARRGEAA